MAKRYSDVLLDPARVAMWSRFRELAAQGIRTLRQWGPADGFAAARSWPVHQHTMPTLVACLSGQLRMEGRDSVELLSGDLLVVEPGCWHRHLPHRPGSTSFALGFIGDRCDLVFYEHQASLWGAVPEQPYRGLVAALVDEHREADRLRLVDEILRGVTGERVDFIDWIEPGVAEMAAWLWQHLHEPVAVDEIIARGGFGRSTGFRLFKEFFGRSPKQELLAQRVDLARHLLHRGFQVAEVAQRSGFTSRAEMGRAFRARLGRSPSVEAAAHRPEQ